MSDEKINGEALQDGLLTAFFDLTKSPSMLRQCKFDVTKILS